MLGRGVCCPTLLGVGTQDAPLSVAGLAAFPGGSDLLGVGGGKKDLQNPSQRREEEEEEERKRGREEVGSLRACPAERKRQRSRSVQRALPRAGSARSHGLDKGIAHRVLPGKKIPYFLYRATTRELRKYTVGIGTQKSPSRSLLLGKKPPPFPEKNKLCRSAHSSLHLQKAAHCTKELRKKERKSYGKLKN